MHFSCPKCLGKLTPDERGNAVCEMGHCYDKSKYGYYNLLLGKGGVHGDSAEMVLARREFLSGGRYQPLADRVAELVTEYARPGGAVLDCGCGEGYYTRAIASALDKNGISADVCGFDISRDAVRCAKRALPTLEAAVASAYHIPSRDGEFSLALNMFSPNAKEEIARVLEPYGIYIMVIPDVEHLYELKARIYDTPYKNQVDDSELQGFELLYTERLGYIMQLNDKKEIRALFGMTPYAYRTNAAGIGRVMELDSLDVTASFIIFVYRKRTE